MARAEDRGLGIQTWELFRAIGDSALVIDMGELARGFPQHLDRYPGQTVVPFEPGVGLPEEQVRDWLAGVDTVYTAETFYDWRFGDWCRDACVAVVCHANPEFYDPHHRCAPTEWWAPTPWLRDHLPGGVPVIPVPVAGDRFPMVPPPPGDRLRVLHVAGHRAAADRNGTTTLLQALRVVREAVDVTIVTQDPRLPRARTPQNVRVTLETGGRANYWDLYAGADVLVMPRRYGGLCLPVQEAMASGLAVIMTDCSPNEWWPTILVPGRIKGTIQTAHGHISTWHASPMALAQAIDELARDPAALYAQQESSLGWAARHTWTELGDVVLDRLHSW